MRISDWSSDVCSSDLGRGLLRAGFDNGESARENLLGGQIGGIDLDRVVGLAHRRHGPSGVPRVPRLDLGTNALVYTGLRSEEHTSELQSLMRISYAVFCLKKKNNIPQYTTQYLLHITDQSA